MSTPFQFLQNVKSSPMVHIGFNYSPLFDMINGRFFKGYDEQYYLNGGIMDNNATVGGSNTQKTGQLVFACRRFLQRFPMGVIIYVDSESTLDIGRLADAVDADFGVPGYFYDEIFDKRFIYKTSKDEFDGTAFHNLIKDAYANFKDNKDNPDMYVQTPFLDKENKRIKCIAPIMVICDSLSDLRFTEASAKFTEGDVDEGGKKRTRDMEFGNLKRVVFEDSSNLGGIAGLRLWWVGQIADMINMDGKPMEKQSTFIRPGKKIAKCPKAILQLPSIGYEIIKGSGLKVDQEWMYPNPFGRDVVIDADARENPDLLLYSFTMYRNKGGSSGLQCSFIGSQSDGIQEGLSMYHTIKTDGYFGLSVGSKVSHACDLMPDLKVGRTTIRKIVNENHQFYRAITICYQMWFMQNYWMRLDHKYRMTPAELYAKVAEAGYDWTELLENSVDYWHLNPDIKKHTLTTMQLLAVACGEGSIPWASNRLLKQAA